MPDLKLMRRVRKDLERLELLVARDDLDEAGLRDMSIRLRALLVEDLYRRAWAQLEPGRAPSILAPVLRPRDIATVRWAQASAETTEGDGRSAYSVPELLVSLGIVFDGRGISRGQIIKYVAHRLGGGHHDPDRDDKRGRELALPDEAAAGNPQGLAGIHRELRAIGRDLARSSDARRFIEASALQR